jgi:hypothetical protein
MNKIHVSRMNLDLIGEIWLSEYLSLTLDSIFIGCLRSCLEIDSSLKPLLVYRMCPGAICPIEIYD